MMEYENNHEREEVRQTTPERSPFETLAQPDGQQAHREEVEREIASAMAEFAQGTSMTRAEVEQRLGDVKERLMHTFDDTARHKLAVERAAILRYRQHLEGLQTEVPSSAVTDAPDMPDVESPVPANETFIDDFRANDTMVDEGDAEVLRDKKSA